MSNRQPHGRYLSLLPFWEVVALLIVTFTNAQAAEPLRLQTGKSYLHVGQYLQFIEDNDHSLAIESLLQTSSSQPWQDHHSAMPNFGFSGATYWLKLDLINADSVYEDEYRLEVAFALQDYIDVYVVAGNSVLQRFTTGDRLRFSSRPIEHRYFQFPLVLPRDEVRTVYIKLGTYDGLFETLPINIATRDFFEQQTQSDYMIFGLLYGAIFILALYNLLLYFSLRDRTFIYFVLFAAFVALWSFSFQGFAFQYFWSETPSLANTAIALTSLSFAAFLTIFSYRYLGVREQSPRLYSALRTFLVAMVAICAPFIFFEMYAAYFAAFLPIFAFNVIVLLGVGIYMARRGVLSAQIYVAAWSFIIGGAILYALKVFGVIAPTPVTENAIHIGSALQIALLSIGLTGKVNSLRLEKERALELRTIAQTDLIKNKELRNNELEQIVAERTVELERINSELKTLSIQDDLTQIHNRRFFNESLEKEWNRHQRAHLSLAILMIDIDYFKKYNDHYGHQRGDDCLRHVANAISESVNRGYDIVARYGGEEFVVALPQTDVEGAIRVAERISSAVSQLGIGHEYSDVADVVTVSIGVACGMPNGNDDPRTMLVRADAALYQSKQRGRNCYTVSE